jgi:hypothetical protein
MEFEYHVIHFISQFESTPGGAKNNVHGNLLRVIRTDVCRILAATGGPQMPRWYAPICDRSLAAYKLNRASGR